MLLFPREIRIQLVTQSPGNTRHVTGLSETYLLVFKDDSDGGDDAALEVRSHLAGWADVDDVTRGN